MKKALKFFILGWALSPFSLVDAAGQVEHIPVVKANKRLPSTRKLCLHLSLESAFSPKIE